MKPVLFSTATLVGPGRSRLEGRFDLVVERWLDPAPPRILSEDEIVARCDDLGAAVLVVEADFLGSSVFDRLDGLAVVVATRGDPWNVDVNAATEAGVLALRTPGRNAGAVAEFTIALMLAAARGVARADADVRAGRFVDDDRIPQQRFRGPQLAGKTLGLVGYGAVGHEAAWRARALGMEVLVYDPYADAHDIRRHGNEPVHDLTDLLSRSLFVSIHAAKTDETTGLIGSAEIEAMPDGSYLINTAREAIVDREALTAALESGKLAGAALDHFEGEFLDPSDPLCSLPNVVLTPHIGGASVDADAAHTTMVADALEALLDGGSPEGMLNEVCLEPARKRLAA